MRIGLCLSGGGTRGIFHIGVLQALEEYDIKPDIVAGSSAGALVGSFFVQAFLLKKCSMSH